MLSVLSVLSCVGKCTPGRIAGLPVRVVWRSVARARKGKEKCTYLGTNHRNEIAFAFFNEAGHVLWYVRRLAVLV
jgi:hypothetical protein